jgi:hypothetical protein
VNEDVQRLIAAYEQACDDLDRLRMAAGEDFRMPVVQLVPEVERLFRIRERVQSLKDHPNPVVRATVWHVLTGEPAADRLEQER